MNAVEFLLTAVALSALIPVLLTSTGTIQLTEKDV